MAWLQLANNAQTVLGGVVSLLAGSITPSSKASFPDPDVDGSFYVTLSDPGYANPTDDSTRETVLVTANDGAAWTVTRAQCGTSAQEHAIADRVSLYLMAEHIEEIEAAVDLNTAARHAAVTVADTTSVDLTLTGQQLSAAVLPAGVNHDALAGFVGNEHIDWTADQEGAAVVHSGNYVDNDTQYTAGDGLALAAGVFSLDPAWVDQVLATTGTPQFERLGLGAAAGTARLTFPAATTAAGGIALGDVELYRSAADVLTIPDKLEMGSNLDLAGNALFFGTADEVKLQYTSHASASILNQYSPGGALVNTRYALRCPEAVANYCRFVAATGTTGALASSNQIGGLVFTITQADPGTLKSECAVAVNTGDSLQTALTIADTQAATFASTVDAVAGFKDNGVAGVDGSFTTADAKTVTVSGGIITAITA